MSRRVTLEEMAARDIGRPGARVFDCAYAIAVFDARTRLILMARIAAEPNKEHIVGHMGYVPFYKGAPTWP